MDLMKRALSLIEDCCDKDNLRVNPSTTTLIPFTRKRITSSLNGIRLFGETHPNANDVKYLGLVVDIKLIWNPHLKHTMKKIINH